MKKEQMIEKFASLGLIVEYNKEESDRDSFFTYHDGIRYMTSIMKPNKYFGYRRNFKEAVQKYHRLVDRYHNIVKSIYEFVKQHCDQNCWVMSGGGAQIQAFFGKDGEYICIAYFDLEDQSHLIKGDEGWSLVTEAAKYDNIFQNHFKVEGINLILGSELYKDEDKDD